MSNERDNFHFDPKEGRFQAKGQGGLRALMEFLSQSAEALGHLFGKDPKDVTVDDLSRYYRDQQDPPQR